MASGGDFEEMNLKTLENVTSIEGPEFEQFRKFVLKQEKSRGEIKDVEYSKIVVERVAQTKIIDKTDLSVSELEFIKQQSIKEHEQVYPSLEAIWLSCQENRVKFKQEKDRILKEVSAVVNKKIRWINTTELLTDAITEIKKNLVIGIDFEFSPSKGESAARYPNWIVLIQIATCSDIFVLDVIVLHQQIKQDLVPKILANPSILKIVLGCSQDVIHCADFLNTTIIHALDLQLYIEELFDYDDDMIIDIFGSVLFDKRKPTTVEKYFDKSQTIKVGSEVLFKSLFSLDQGDHGQTNFAVRRNGEMLNKYDLSYAAADAEFTLKSLFKLNNELIKRGITWDDIQKIIRNSYTRTKCAVKTLPRHKTIECASKTQVKKIVSLLPHERNIFGEVYYMLLEMGYQKFLRLNNGKKDDTIPIKDKQGYYFKYFSLDKVAKISRNFDGTWMKETRILWENMKHEEYKSESWKELGQRIWILLGENSPLDENSYDDKWTDLDSTLVSICLLFLNEDQREFKRNDTKCRNCNTRTHVGKFCLMDTSGHAKWRHQPENRELKLKGSVNGAISVYLRKGYFLDKYPGSRDESIVLLQIDEFLTNRKEPLVVNPKHPPFFFFAFEEAKKNQQLTQTQIDELTGSTLRENIVLLYNKLQTSLSSLNPNLYPRIPVKVEEMIDIKRFIPMYENRQSFKAPVEMKMFLNQDFKHPDAYDWLYNILKNFN